MNEVFNIILKVLAFGFVLLMLFWLIVTKLMLRKSNKEFEIVLKKFIERGGAKYFENLNDTELLEQHKKLLDELNSLIPNKKSFIELVKIHFEKNPKNDYILEIECKMNVIEEILVKRGIASKHDF